MATKGFNKILSKGKSIFGNSSAPAASQDPRELTSGTREREKVLQTELASLLSDLEYNPDFKLPKEKINEFKIPLRIAKMIRSLETPLVTETDESALDALILGFVHALRKALRLGYENAAYWSSLALHHSLESLHLPVDEYDKEFSELLYTRKLEYAKTLDIIIKHANKLDELDETISADEKEYNRWIKEQSALKEDYNALKTSARGIDLINRTQMKAANPSTMDEDEADLFAMLRRIQELKKLLANKTHIRNINLEAYRTASLAIQQYNDQLRQKPTVDDKQLAAKMAVVDERFLAKLDEKISATLTIKKGMDAYTTKLAELAKRIEKDTAREIAEIVDDLEMEAVDRSLAKKESAEMAARVHANMRELQRQEELINNQILAIEQNLQQEIEQNIQRERELEKAREIEVHEEVESEQEYLVEDEFV